MQIQAKYWKKIFKHSTKFWFSIKEIKLYGLNLLSCVDTTSNHQSKTSIKNCIFHCGEEESREIIKLRH